LTPQETGELIKILKDLSNKGLSIVFISHKLEEVMNLCDRVTVLRHGKVVSTVDTENVDKAALAKMMVGREVLFGTVGSAAPGENVILEVKRISASNDRGLSALKDVSFEIHEGEIFGIAGVDGNGQAELAEVVAGLRKPLEGNLFLRGNDITPFDALKRMQLGVGYIPENRHKKGLVMGFGMWENFILKEASAPKFSYKGLYFKFGEIKDHVQSLVTLFDIRGPGREMPIMNYSGGNQQKVVLAREFALGPSLLVAAQPTRGLDVGAIEFVHGQILEFSGLGNGVLLISTELEEILSLCHRFAVIYEGQLAGTIENRGQIDLEEMGLMMAGSKRLQGHTR
jgi:simple sugar transport system ATP-binding protein